MANFVHTAVERLLDAQVRHRPLTPLSDTDPDLTLERAYAVQDALRSELNRLGRRPIGWKLGATSPSGQAASGVKAPLSGFLMSRRYDSGAEVSASECVSLSVEAEVAFRMRTRLAGEVTAATAMLATEGALASLEIGDFIFSGKPLVTDVVASKHLSTRGLALEPGDIVISGAISKVLRPKAGDAIQAHFEHLGSVSIRVVA
jgi:2-keto-4-pentenoate hydratase